MNTKTYLNYVDGDWVPSCSGKTFSVFNPADQSVIASVQESNEQDMEKAIEAAENAFNNTDWRKNPSLRTRALMELASLLADKKEMLSKLYTLDNGKTISESRIELNGSVNVLRYCAGWASNLFGRAIQPAENAFSVIVREPIGVVGVISPWNSPLRLMFRDVIPALAAGNAVVLKPASITAAITMETVEVLVGSNIIPRGILNVVTGPGQSIGESLAANDKVGMVCFTGDNITGQRVAELASRTIKKVTLELGGKSPNIIFEDADLEKAIPLAIKAVFRNCGQVCTAGTRLVVQDTIYDEVVGRMKVAAENLKVCNGLDEESQMGPLVSQKQVESVMRYIEMGKKEGRLITGGHRLQGPGYDNGNFIAPTIFADLDHGSTLVQQEIFGPVLIIEKFHTEEEAIKIGNGTKFGLAGAVWTSNLNRAIRVAKEIRSGTIWVNTYSKTYEQAEFGGYKASGIGRSRGIEGILDFTEIKHINFDLE